MPKVLLLNGPNLNLLGSREPEIYGSTTLKEIEEKVAAVLSGHEIECETFQSNSEGEIIDWLHKHRGADFLLLIAAEFAVDYIEQKGNNNSGS